MKAIPGMEGEHDAFCDLLSTFEDQPSCSLACLQRRFGLSAQEVLALEGTK